ncbi:MAG TPA: hypothetical protein VKB59_06960 [Micromonosporaceae bacterium]|jgi:hypothetical protein|nr:hypothetical protein [Micromonosporaceae bacterium]HKE64378.1 hypothetical protein [Micromonosporaceae bacterium]
MWWIVGVVGVVVVVATYLTWIAGRVDRTHERAAASASALDSALLRRAVAALDAAAEMRRPDLGTLARTALARDAGTATDRESAENALTKGLRDLPYGIDAPEMAGIVAASRRVSLARHIHSDLVRDALAMRRRRLVRLLRFGHRHPVPRYFDIEDPILGPVSA